LLSAAPQLMPTPSCREPAAGGQKVFDAHNIVAGGGNLIHGEGNTMRTVIFRPGTFALAFVMAALATAAAAQPLEPPSDRDLARDHFRDIAPPSVACPDQQALDEVDAMRRLGDRESEAITRRSWWVFFVAFGMLACHAVNREFGIVLATAFGLCLAAIAFAYGEPAFKILKNVPTELRGFWCLHGKGEPVTNPWTGNMAKEYAAHRCWVNNKTEPAQIEKLPDLTIEDEYIHVRMDAKCHVDRVGQLPGQVYILKTTCVNRSLRDPLFIGTDPGFLWLDRDYKGDLRIVAE
jgi:hypothetical protein